jgi:tRNA threonylcarbamoyladenosine biosynthesis protein TsaE
VLYYEINTHALREDGMDYLTHNEIETEALGETLARRLGPGDVVAYRGDLGAGKTAFTRGLARGLGCTGRVTSPTFTVVNEYEGRLPLFHFDLYRLEGEDALYDIGWEDYLDRGGVCAVEWSERAEAALPRETVWVSIRRCAESEDWRRITIEGRAGDEAAGP